MYVENGYVQSTGTDYFCRHQLGYHVYYFADVLSLSDASEFCSGDIYVLTTSLRSIKKSTVFSFSQSFSMFTNTGLKNKARL